MRHCDWGGCRGRAPNCCGGHRWTKGARGAGGTRYQNSQHGVCRGRPWRSGPFAVSNFRRTKRWAAGIDRPRSQETPTARRPSADQPKTAPDPVSASPIIRCPPVTAATLPSFAEGLPMFVTRFHSGVAKRGNTARHEGDQKRTAQRVLGAVGYFGEGCCEAAHHIRRAFPRPFR